MIKNIRRLIDKFKLLSTEKSVSGDSVWDFYIYKNLILYECIDTVMIFRNYPHFIIETYIDFKKRKIKVQFYNRHDPLITGLTAKDTFIKTQLMPIALAREFKKLIDK